MVVTTDNLRLPIKCIGDSVIVPSRNPHKVELQNIMHVEEIKKNFLFVSQLTTAGNYVVFGLQNVMLYRDVNIIGTSILEGEKQVSVYVISAETTYVEKTRKNKIADLCHIMLLGHVSYKRLKVMMMKSMLKRLPNIEVRDKTIYVGC